MDFLPRLRFANIPNWSKYLFFIVLIIVGICNTVAFFEGIIYGIDSWVEVSLRLLGVFLPIFSIVYVAIYLRFGEGAIVENTKMLYLDMLPKALKQTEEQEKPFYKAHRQALKEVGGSENITIETNYKLGNIDSDFVLRFIKTGGLIVIRLEVNYRRINFNLYFTPKQVAKIAKVELEECNRLNTVHNATKILEALGHSLAGAKYFDEKAGARDDGSEAYQSGYVFNDKLIERELNGRHYLCLVGMRSVSSNFIWDVGERYYFCFDLMLMLRAMLSECPSIKMSEEDVGQFRSPN